MPPGYLRQNIKEDFNTHPEDVITTKDMLKSMGYYDPPRWGVTPYPDTGLFEGIERYQRQRGLKVDRMMKPGGETENALLNDKMPLGKPLAWDQDNILWEEKAAHSIMPAGNDTFKTKYPFQVDLTLPSGRMVYDIG